MSVTRHAKLHEMTNNISCSNIMEEVVIMKLVSIKKIKLQEKIVFFVHLYIRGWGKGLSGLLSVWSLTSSTTYFEIKRCKKKITNSHELNTKENETKIRFTHLKQSFKAQWFQSFRKMKRAKTTYLSSATVKSTCYRSAENPGVMSRTFKNCCM